MSEERQLENIAAQLDDLSLQVEEVKDVVSEEESEAPAQALEKIEKDIARAADAIEDATDPE